MRAAGLPLICVLCILLYQQMWINEKNGVVQSVVLDFTYNVIPFFDLFQAKHSARILVVLDLVEVPKARPSAEPTYLVSRQEDFIQWENMIAAFFPNVIATIVILTSGILVRINGIVIVNILGPLMSLLRLLLG